MCLDCRPIKLIFGMPIEIKILMAILIVMNFYLYLFVSYLQRKMRAQLRLKGHQVTFSEQSYLMKLSPNLVLLSYTYVDFNAFDDFDSFKVASPFICLLFTRIVNNHISRTNPFIMFILRKKEVSNDNLLHITKKALPSSTICKKPLVDITNITAAGSFQKRSIKKNTCTFYVNAQITGLWIIFLNFQMLIISLFNNSFD